MLGKNLINAAAGNVETGPVDPDFSSVEALLHCDGTNGSTTFIDSSSNNATLTAGGNTSITTTYQKFGTGSATLDGATDSISIPDLAALRIGTAPFTIEFFAWHTTLGSERGIIRKGTSGSSTWTLYQYPSNCLTWGIPFVSNDLTTGNVLNTTGFQHIAVVRDSGNTLRIFVDGTQRASSSSYTKSLGTTTSPVVFGLSHQSNASNGFAGRMDELRITVGVGRYTSNFSVPTAPFPDR